LQQDRAGNDHHAPSGAEADAGGDMKNAHRKSHERQDREKAESNPAVQFLRPGMDSLDVDQLVDQNENRGEPGRHHGDAPPGKLSQADAVCLGTRAIGGTVRVPSS